MEVPATREIAVEIGHKGSEFPAAEHNPNVTSSGACSAEENDLRMRNIRAK